MNDTHKIVPREPLHGRALLLAVRDLIAVNADRGRGSRFDQGEWVSSRYDVASLRVEEIRAVMDKPVPDQQPDDPECGTVGCAAGWGAIMSAPAGTRVIGAGVFLPDGSVTSVSRYAQDKFGISQHVANMLFSGENTAAYMITALTMLARDPGADIARIDADGELYGRNW